MVDRAQRCTNGTTERRTPPAAFFDLAHGTRLLESASDGEKARAYWQEQYKSLGETLLQDGVPAASGPLSKLMAVRAASSSSDIQRLVDVEVVRDMGLVRLLSDRDCMLTLDDCAEASAEGLKLRGTTAA